MNPTQMALADVRKWQQERHALSPDRKNNRTASTAPVIVHGTDAQRYRLWQECIGEIGPEDLSNVFAVQWGKHNETFCLDWLERTTQHEITERQRWIKHPTLPIGATLDGYRPFDEAVVEVKVLSPFAKSTDVGSEIGFTNYYAPQVAVQMECRNVSRGYLAVQQGNSPPQLFEINADPDYRSQVIERIVAFHACVETRTPPGPPPPAPVPAELWRIVDLNASQTENWGPPMKQELLTWKRTRDTAKEHDATKKAVKELLPEDVGRVTYGSIIIRRARNGAVSITEDA